MSRITVFAGHYGSGKTLLAVNYALSLSKRGKRVILADLDIVNPYFRTNDHARRLNEAGVKLIVSKYAGSNAELPGFPPEAAAAFDDTDSYAVLDVGGDDRGALALGRFAARLEKAGYSMLLVANAYRPLTARPEQLAEIKQEIERASRVRFTGVVNNSHLSAQTTAGDILASREYISAVCAATGLPLVFTSARKDIAAKLPEDVGTVFPISVFPLMGLL
ncbi:MAG: hypothetical protein LBR85_04545 [Oscillospiraceae bacterium]|jgi:MinD-like ATPase involved in chromosome partitioning or flagellar assembly|nr:hypothetical protein [Oscillospiraceae bacterium]